MMHVLWFVVLVVATFAAWCTAAARFARDTNALHVNGARGFAGHLRVIASKAEHQRPKVIARELRELSREVDESCRDVLEVNDKRTARSVAVEYARRCVAWRKTSDAMSRVPSGKPSSKASVAPSRADTPSRHTN
jgi:hypothetical protein